jgi:signal transduction histidine kinase
MWELLALGFAVAALALVWRHAALRRTVRDLADAAEARAPFLMGHTDLFRRNSHLARLLRAHNALVAQHDQISRQEQGYLAQIDATLGNITEAVLIINADQRLVLANAAAAELLGAEKVALGQRLESAVRGGPLLDYIYRTIRGDSLPRAEFPLPRGRDQPRWIELSGAPVAAHSPDGSPLYLFVLHDITRLKNLESVRKEFVANVSHELRTPVTIIKGFADMLVEDDARLPAADRLRFLEKIRRNTERLAALVDDLLTLSRLESDQQRLDAHPQSLRALIEEEAAEFADRFRAAGVTLELDLRHTSDFLPLDSLKMSQVYHNLLDNCFRYAKGFTRVRILTREEDSLVRVTIEDNGCGIPAADVSHVFERFYRVDKGRSRESGGTGLGLSIVKHIIQLHDGTVACESEEKSGTRMHFTLPVPVA